MSSKKQVAKKQSTDMAVMNFEEDAGQGFEEADVDSFAVPFLGILQKNSPQCDEDAGEFMDDAKPGMFMDSVSNELFDGEQGIRIVPCAFKRVFVEWIPRDSGGGIAGIHDAVAGAEILLGCTKNEKGKDVMPNGNELVDTRQHYSLVIREDGTYFPVVIAFTSTQLKKSRKWMTVMDNAKMFRKDGTSFTPAMFANSYRAVSVPESNDKGTWKGWKISDRVVIEATDLYGAAKAFRDKVVAGTVEVQQQSQEQESNM